MAFLKVNGVDFSPYIKELQTDRETIWNEKAGRTIDNNATFVGRIIAKKWKLNIGTRVLSQKESSIIHNALHYADFLDIQFVPTNSATDEMVTIKAYVSTIKNTVYSYNDKLPRYSNASFNLIEQ